MTFNSFEFLIFFPIFLLCYFLLPKKLKMPAMLAMSYWFYAAWNFRLLALIIFTTAVSYFCALAMEKTDKKSLRRLYITLTLIVCLGTLFFFKYYNFMAGTVSGIMSAINGKSYDFSLNLILPVGISFYTFQTLSYAIDVYRGDIKAERNFFWYALFVSFFPQLVAGPIERPENLLPQLKNFNRLNAENAFLGMQKMAVGFFKKIAVADILAGYVNSVYNDIGKATAIGIIIATVLFAVQIYCDFSGYTDIAIGCARIMGIRLMQNFDRPYSARSIKEFWDRWHVNMVPRLSLHTAGRQQMLTRKVLSESFHRISRERLMARCKLDLCNLGCAPRIFPHIRLGYKKVAHGALYENGHKE